MIVVGSMVCGLRHDARIPRRVHVLTFYTFLGGNGLCMPTIHSEPATMNFDEIHEYMDESNLRGYVILSAQDEVRETCKLATDVYV